MKPQLLIFLLLFSTTLLYSQIIKQENYHAFSGTMVITVEGGATYGYSDYRSFKPDFMGKGLVEYYFPSKSKSIFGLRAFGGIGYIAGNTRLNLNPQQFRTDLYFTGGGLIYALSLNDVVFPYLFAGASYLWFNPKDGNGVSINFNVKKHEVNYNSEIGFRFLLTDDLSLNISGGVQISPRDYLDGLKSGTSNDIIFHSMVGFSFAFFTKKDSDGDGVPDHLDRCPDTPPGVKVDAFGCPIDSDGDGVPDYLDKCPNTPSGVKVDVHGCPLDSDSDGVPDYLDICPDTPLGVKVDEFGCPPDSDKDGVPDYLDLCPNTPYGVEVDEFGCPKDSDGDSVPDYLDKCPDTPKGTPVDEHGCPIVEEEVKEVVLSGGANFGFNSAQLLPSAYAELDKLVEAMKRNPATRWRIEGHTDNIGSDAGNKRISQMRAESVQNYFVSKGIDARRFQVVGLGKDFPIANNSTEAGRAQNRRVVILRLE